MHFSANMEFHEKEMNERLKIERGDKFCHKYLYMFPYAAST